MAYYHDSQLTIHNGDALSVLQTMQAESVQCCITSPPYFGLRDYGHAAQIGLEQSPEEYVARLVEVFREVRRVLRDDGTCWVNLGDSYANDGKWGGYTGGKHARNLHGSPIGRNKRYTGLKPKDLIGIPWMVAFALRADGWFLRQDIIWAKPNPMPESVTDRCTKSHEYVFLLSKSSRYFYDADAIKEPAIYADDDRKGRAELNHKCAPSGMVNGIRPRADKQRGHSRRHAGLNDRWDAMKKEEQCSGMRNKRSVWNVATRPYVDAHFAVFPSELIEPCILAGSRVGDTVLDPFGGSGTTAEASNRFGRKAVLIELNPDYCELSIRRNYQKTVWAATEVAA